jgi:protein O-GlcNAc transferase
MCISPNGCGVLPHFFLPADPDRVIDATPQTRAMHCLPDVGLVLVCFSNTFMVTAAVWAVWKRLMAALPDAVLWLLGGLPRAEQNLSAQAQDAGVDPVRLVFAPKVP